MELMLSLTHVARPLLAQQLDPGCHSLLSSTAQCQGEADTGFPFILEEITLQMMCCKGKVSSATEQPLVCCGGFTL